MLVAFTYEPATNVAEPCAAANRLRGHGACGRPPPPFHPPAGAAPAPPVAELGVVRRSRTSPVMKPRFSACTLISPRATSLPEQATGFPERATGLPERATGLPEQATGLFLHVSPESNRTPNHALQRTGSAVTAPAADHHRLSTHRQVPRPLRLSLSLGSLGVSSRTQN